MNSSRRSTLRLLVQPVDFHGTSQVSGISRAGSGPSLRSRLRMSRRQPLLAATQSRLALRQPPTAPPLSQSAMSARYSAKSSAGRIMPCNSTNA